MAPSTIVVAITVLLANVTAWAAFRLDKRAAKRGTRRTPERALMWWAAAGPFGALIAMYRHRARHKVQKRLFAWVVPALATLHVLLGGAAALWALGVIP